MCRCSAKCFMGTMSFKPFSFLGFPLFSTLYKEGKLKRVREGAAHGRRATKLQIWDLNTGFSHSGVHSGITMVFPDTFFIGKILVAQPAARVGSSVFLESTSPDPGCSCVYQGHVNQQKPAREGQKQGRERAGPLWSQQGLCNIRGWAPEHRVCCRDQGLSFYALLSLARTLPWGLPNF